jgi:prepilin-type N-terminal cleavage/methylation domain-containing protein
MSLPYHKRKQLGFTLIELLIVIAIIAILITIGLAAYSRAQKSARDGQRRSDIRNIAGALEQYYSDYNTYPSTLHALTSAPHSQIYLKVIPTDPTSGSIYDYTSDGQTYCIYSDNMETIDTKDMTCPNSSTTHKYTASSQE